MASPVGTKLSFTYWDITSINWILGERALNIDKWPVPTIDTVIGNSCV